ncbi:hypothetical protein [Paenibacillus alvei]|uniref:hypothetical protein n=1 Tax=Paenibacillus alvei TaxID=44250 RepID=UPI001F48A447|nr:hypothetical protein [Paenibacillus alvei]
MAKATAATESGSGLNLDKHKKKCIQTVSDANRYSAHGIAGTSIGLYIFVHSDVWRSHCFSGL